VRPATGISVRLTASIERVPTYLYGSAQAFRDAIEGYIRASLRRGGLHGWDVDDMQITIVDCEYTSPSTTAADFRRIIPSLMREALAKAGTELCEPVQRVEVTCPDDTLAAVLRAVAHHGLSIDGTELDGGVAVIRGTISAARLRDLEAALPGLTRGEGSVTAEGVGWRPIGR
jgi:ribosomal protection tetracycline resistance protein